MAEYVCLVQEGQEPARVRVALSEGLQRIGREHLGDPAEGVEIQWMPIREGFGFTAGRPSTASMVVRSVPVGFSADRREALLSAVCALWTDVTGCTTDEIVVTALDGPIPI